MNMKRRSRCGRPPWAVPVLVLALSLAQAMGEDPAPQPLTTYQGRTIAPTMPYQGASWLIRDERQREEDCATLLKELRLKPGMTVCDMGCGNGYYSLQMAKKVGARGSVLGVDIQPEMLRLLEARAAEQGIENVEPVLGTPYDPKLPAGKVDLILCVDVYHEFSFPEHMLRAMRKSLSPRGVVVLAEYREEDPDVPIKPLHKMSKRQIHKELEPNGFRLVREFDGLPWQHLMFFGRDDQPLERDRPPGDAPDQNTPDREDSERNGGSENSP